ncbi:MAG: DUF445 family protein [Prevotella sp.]|nr:DUF445 family protein [Prevotella sp.]
MELSYIIAPILGGVIGYITNDIAIRMLFRPHKAKHVFGIHVPFTPGIIPKEKRRIAEAIGAAISENLMSKEVLGRYLLSDDMLNKIRSSTEEFLNTQKTNEESVRQFLGHYLSVEEVANISSNINEGIAQQTYTKLADPAFGNTVAKVVMEHVSKTLSGDGAKVLLAGIGGLAKGLNGIAASLLGVDIVGKFLGLLREPAERFLANNINEMLRTNGKEIVCNMVGSEIDSFLDKPIIQLLDGHDEQLTQIPYAVESIYKTIITEHLPHILESLDISKIVSERINEMDMDETEKLIFQVMDKELKAIVWLGALLGCLLGAINILI